MLCERWNKSQRAEDKWDKGKVGSNVMLDGSLELRVTRRPPISLTLYYVDAYGLSLDS